MTDLRERADRATRALRAWDEFFAPMISDLREVYTERLVEVANIELDRAKRADKLTALSNALRILDTLEGGMKATIRDGEVAASQMVRVEKIEGMTAPQRRLFGMVPSR